MREKTNVDSQVRQVQPMFEQLEPRLLLDGAPFSVPHDVAVGNGPVGIVSGDFNGDGLVDLAVTNPNDDDVSVLHGLSGGGFGRQDVVVGDDPRGIVSDDFNDDGWMDLAVTNYTGKSVYVLYGLEAGGFDSQRVVSSSISTLHGIVSGDFNDDGRADLAVTSITDVGDGLVCIMYGLEAGGFGNFQIVAVGRFPLGIVSGDFNGDERTDLAVTNYFSNNVSVLYGLEAGGFGNIRTVAVGERPYGIVSGHFNGDGRVDLAVTNEYDDDVSVLYGLSEGGFERQDVPVGDGPRGIVLDDFNGDGRADLAIANLNGNDVSVVYGLVVGGFNSRQDVAVGSGPWEIVSGDFNGDGRADLAVTNFYDDDISVLYNQQGVKVIRPGAGVSEWESSDSAGKAADSEWADEGGMVLDPGLFSGDAQPVYRFNLPESIIVGENTSVTVSIYGKGKDWSYEPALWVGPEGSRYLLTDHLPEAEGWTHFEVPADQLAGLMVDAGAVMPGYTLDVMVDAQYDVVVWDWYDLKEVRINYTHEGVSSLGIQSYQTVLNGASAVLNFYEDIASAWPQPLLAQGDLAQLLQPSIPTVSLGVPFLDIAWETFGLIHDFELLYDVLGGVFTWMDFMMSVDVYPGSETNSAFQAFANLGTNWWDALEDDGQISDGEAGTINSAIQNTQDRLDDLEAELIDVAADMEGFLSHTDPGVVNYAKLGLQALAPMLLFDPDTGDGPTANSYLPALNQMIGDLWVNRSPTGISLSSTSVPENQPTDTVVGTFSTTDDPGDTHAYELVSGAGDDDNGSFWINVNTLKTDESFNYEGKDTYSIRVRSTDQDGLYTDKIFTINVTNVNEQPTDIALSNNAVAENQPAGTVVGVLSGTDPDAGQSATLTFSLVPGYGDNSQFSIDPATKQLKTAAAFDFESKSSYSIKLLATDAGSPVLSYEEVFAVNVIDVPDATIAGRYVFYNRSYFDGNDVAANTADDTAIDTSKTSLLPGQTATFANYTSYSRGINGIMIDIDGLAGTPTASDFTFKVGNNDDPSTWVTAATPTIASPRAGEGVDGSDRVTIIWADGTIQKQWLQVTVLATANTGLAEPDVFYFGNLPADFSGAWTVNVADLGILAGSYGQTFPAPVMLQGDANADCKVDVADLGIMASSYGLALSTLTAPVSGGASAGATIVMAGSGYDDPYDGLAAPSMTNPILGQVSESARLPVLQWSSAMRTSPSEEAASQSAARKALSGTLDSNLLVPSPVDIRTDRPMALATANTDPGDDAPYGGTEPFDDDLMVDLLAGLEAGVFLRI